MSHKYGVVGGGGGGLVNDFVNFKSFLYKNLGLKNNQKNKLDYFHFDVTFCRIYLVQNIFQIMKCSSSGNNI